MAKPDEAIVGLPRAVRLRKAMEELGPTFVKLAQVLATRPDLIPSEWADEFAKLQDDVAQVPSAQILAVIHDELGDRVDDLFESIEPDALAAASIAQVHRAKLEDGTEVVLKVLRPGIRETLTADMEILDFFARFLEDHFQDIGFSPTDTVDQFARALRRETDFLIEARSTDRMYKNFEDDPDVHFPRVYWEATTSKVLCLEYVEGTLLSRRGVDEFTAAETRAIVANGARAVFRQCLEIGFFHADPHPGNIIALRSPEGQAGPICFIDCGMTGHIDPKTAEYLADLTQGTAAGDLERVIYVLVALSDADPAIVSNRDFRADVWEFISHFQEASFRELQMGTLLGEFFEKMRAHRLCVPADMVFLIKAITTIEGVGEELCPEFDIIEHVRPSVERLVRRRYGAGALRKRLQGSFIGYAEFAEALPRDVGQLLATIRRRQLTINLEHRGLDRLTKSLEHASRNISRALFITALIVASSILVLADSAAEPTPGHLTIAAVAGFAAAMILALLGVTIGRNR
jgi:ubiquinone biosynthesis protein